MTATAGRPFDVNAVLRSLRRLPGTLPMLCSRLDTRSRLMSNLSRRELALGTAAMLIGDARLQFASPQPARASRTRLILLGTVGGPRPRKTRFPTSQVVLVNDAAYVFD